MADVVVMVPGVPLVTVGAVVALTVNVAVAVVLLSVIVAVQLDVPVVKTAWADVFVILDADPKLSPEQLAPLTLNSVLAVKFPAAMSVDHRVLAPVNVSVGVVLVLPEFGEIDRVAVET